MQKQARHCTPPPLSYSFYACHPPSCSRAVPSPVPFTRVVDRRVITPPRTAEPFKYIIIRKRARRERVKENKNTNGRLKSQKRKEERESGMLCVISLHGLDQRQWQVDKSNAVISEPEIAIDGRRRAREVTKADSDTKLVSSALAKITGRA